MSIVRWGEDGSQVYIIRLDKEPASWQCIACDEHGADLPTDQMVQHIQTHIANGWRVPDYVIPAILKDAP